jgi:hypothetical protein
MRHPEDAFAEALPLELQRMVLEEARLAAKLRDLRTRREKLERVHQVLLQTETDAPASLRVA